MKMNVIEDEKSQYSKEMLVKYLHTLNTYK